MLGDILQFLYHFGWRHIQSLGHLQSRKERKSTSNQENVNHRNALVFAALLDEWRDDEWSWTNCRGYLSADRSNLRREYFELSHTEKAITNTGQHSKKRKSYYLKNWKKNVTLSRLIALSQQQNKNRYNYTQNWNCKHNLLSLEMIYQKNAKSRRYDFRGAQYYGTFIDVQCVVLHAEFWDVELETNEEVKKDAEDRNRAEWVIPKEV